MMHQLQPDTAAHNIPSVFRIHGSFQLQPFKEAFKQVVTRHENFRTYFEMCDGKLMQNIVSEIDVDVPLISLGGGKKEPIDQQIDPLVRQEVQKPFSLTRGPLIRARLIAVADNDVILIITMHHVITDLKTKDLFAQELSAQYSALLNNRDPQIDDRCGKFRDYSRWHDKWLAGDDAARMLTYWKGALKNQSGFLKLPLDNTRPAVQRLNGTAIPLNMPNQLTHQLIQYCRKKGVPIFLTLLSAYFVLLKRYAGQSDITVGVPLTNRRREADKETFGCFVNILPIAIDCEGETSFESLQSQVRLAMLGAHRNQEVTLDSIVEHLKPVRDVSYNPLFQAGFTFEHPMTLSLTGASVETIPIHSGGAQIDLFFTLWNKDDKFDGFIEFNTDIFDLVTIERLKDNYITLLNAVVESPTRNIDKLPILSDDQRNTILVHWNDTEVDYPGYQGIHQLFEKQVERSPDVIALEYKGIQLSYSELNQRANQLAHYLIQSGVGPDATVGIFMERSIEMLVAIYGIVKAGGAYLPLDPEYPDNRLSVIAEDAQLALVLTQNHLKERLADLDTQILALDTGWLPLGAQRKTNPEVQCTSLNLAYVIYTSGSTGKPKGVMNSHAGILNRILWMQDAYALDETDVVLQKTPFTFDVSVWEFFWPLMAGAKLVIAPPESHKNPAQLVDLINEAQVSTIHFVPSMLKLFLDHGKAASCMCLKRVICSGEALPLDLKTTFHKILRADLHNLYGPTEAAVDVTYFHCRPDQTMRTVPIGRPVANTAIYILDAHMQPVPVGVAGELHIGGVQVARGYLNRPDLTRERFVPDPYTSHPDARLYKTGDLARFLPDGNIEYLGRLDHQVKIGGLRIELGEIEQILIKHPGIQTAAVLKKDFGGTDQRLVAYMVPDKTYSHTVRRTFQYEKRSADSGTSLYRLPNNMVVRHLNMGETDFMFREVFTQNQYLCHGITLKPNDCIFDVGANIGLFSLFVGSRVKDARIFAFEPLPPIFECLETNASFYPYNINVFNFGLSDTKRLQQFDYYTNISILSGSHADISSEKEVLRSFLKAEQGIGGNADVDLSDQQMNEMIENRLQTESYTCQLHTLSDVIHSQKTDHIDLLKIDVEKSELEVVKGIQEDHWSKIRQIVMEIHEGGQLFEQISNILIEKGFDVIQEEDDMLSHTGLSMLYATKLGHDQRTEPDFSIVSMSEYIPRWFTTDDLIADAKDFLKQHLPEYMVPSLYVTLEKMPLSANGKIDRKMLPVPELKNLALAREYVPPANELEKTIVNAWCGILKIDNVGTQDNFFDVGGTSLLAVQLISELNRKLDKNLSVVAIFQYPTVQAFTIFLSQSSKKESFGKSAADRSRKRQNAFARRKSKQKS